MQFWYLVIVVQCLTVRCAKRIRTRRDCFRKSRSLNPFLNPKKEEGTGCRTGRIKWRDWKIPLLRFLQLAEDRIPSSAWLIEEQFLSLESWITEKITEKLTEKMVEMKVRVKEKFEREDKSRRNMLTLTLHSWRTP